jgi:hypothetical protein
LTFYETINITGFLNSEEKMGVDAVLMEMDMVIHNWRELALEESDRASS